MLPARTSSRKSIHFWYSPFRFMGTTTVPGWGLHGIVLGVLVVIGIVATLIEVLSPSKGGWITLRGILSFMIWIALGLFAAASTLTFALFRHRWGVFPCYLAALPLAAAPVLVRWGLGHLSYLRSYKLEKAELVSRFDLVSWSPRSLEKGRLRVDAEIRALRNLDIHLNVLGMDANRMLVTRTPKEPEAIRVTAGATARLSVDVEFPPDRPVVDYTLEFTTSVEGQSGQTWYDEVKADETAGAWHIRRPLPPAAP